MLSQGIIRPSESAWSSPIWIVPKKPDASGKTKWRLVVDFRKLNEKTIDDKYPIPNINDVLDKLEYTDCFEKCKNLLTNDPILQYPNFNKEFILTTDASNVALGAILSQGPEGADKQICYASRTLNDSELNYSTIEKELLAIVWATKYFRPYLFGRKFKIITDHKPLQWVMQLKEPNARLTRWKLKLSEYDFTVKYKSGKSNTNADALSRVEIHNEETDSMIALASERPPSVENSSTASAHTSKENPILEVPIVDQPLNKFHRQIVISVVGDIKKRPVASKPFDTHNRIAVQVSKSDLENDVHLLTPLTRAATGRNGSPPLTQHPD
ncbi:unnamed protein product [Parnassius mnemosyne]